MASPVGKFTVRPQTATLVVSVIGDDPTCWTGQDGNTTIAMPATITSDTDFWLTFGHYTVTCTWNGVLIDTSSVLIQSGTAQVINPDVDTFAEWASEAAKKADSATSVPFLSPSGADDTAAINARLASGGLCVLHGDFIISTPLLIPSNTTLVLWEASVFLTAASNCPMVQNADLTNGNANVSIKGIGRALFNGNGVNQVRQTNLWHNYGFLFNKLTRFRIEDVQVGPTNAWGIMVQNSTKGRLSRIRFEQDGLTINQDGIDLHGACSEILIENITGVTNDDAVALTSFTTLNALTVVYGTPGGDMTKIQIRNIAVDTGGNNLIRILNGDGQKITHVALSGLHHLSTSPRSLVKFGEASYVTTPPTTSTCTDFTIDDVRGGCNPGTPGPVFAFDQSVHNCRISGVTVDKGFDSLVGTTAIASPAQTIEYLSVRDVAIVVQQATAAMCRMQAGCRITQLTLEGVNAIDIGTILSNAGPVTHASIKNININTLRTAVINSTTAEGGQIDGVNVVNFVGSARYSGAAIAMRIGPSMPIFTSADTTPNVATKGSRILCDHTKDPTGGASGTGGEYIASGAAWTKIVDLGASF